MTKSPLDVLMHSCDPKFPEPKNLRLLLDLGVITKTANAQTASAAWWSLCFDPIVAEREETDPSPQRYREFPNNAIPRRRTIRYEVVRKVVAAMSDEERAALRERLMAKRVTGFRAAPKAPPADVLFI